MYDSILKILGILRSMYVFRYVPMYVCIWLDNIFLDKCHADKSYGLQQHCLIYCMKCDEAVPIFWVLMMEWGLLG
jgi:hypothetical protein